MRSAGRAEGRSQPGPCEACRRSHGLRPAGRGERALLRLGRRAFVLEAPGGVALTLLLPMLASKSALLWGVPQPVVPPLTCCRRTRRATCTGVPQRTAARRFVAVVEVMPKAVAARLTASLLPLKLIQIELLASEFGLAPP